MLNNCELVFKRDDKVLRIICHCLDAKETREDYEKEGWTFVKKTVRNY